LANTKDANASPIFARQATGLVKELSFLDQFLMSQGIVAILVGFGITAFSAPYYFPGANLEVVFVLGTIPAIAMAAAYSKVSALIPRSGGDYVWSSRVLGPLFGSVQTVFIFMTTIVAFSGFALWSSVALGLSATFFGLGVSSHSATMFNIGSALSTASLGYPIVLLLLVLVTFLAIVSLRTYSLFQRVAMSFVFLITAVFIIALFVINPSTVPSSFNNGMSLAGYNTTYNGIISAASSHGFTTSGFNWTNTILASIPWGFLTFTGFNYGTYLSGETRNVKSSIFRALMLSVFITAVALVIMAFGTYYLFGSNFMNSAAFVSSNVPGLLPGLPAPMFLLSFVNAPVGAIVGIAFFISDIVVAAAYIITISRLLFAVSFDRLLPSSFSSVNERFHTPHWPIIFTGIMSALYSTLYWNFSFASTWLNTSVVFPIGYLLPLIAILLFPYIKKDLFTRLGGNSRDALILTISSLVGIGSFVFYIFAETYPIASGVFLGASLTVAYIFFGVLLAIGVIIYITGRVRMNRMGIRLQGAYSEIPPE
jgi:APA family basic amino acid/polyamine antiporter